MSDELKDFRYYADKAEEYLDAYKELDGAYTRQSAETLLRTAAVYAELAKAAPKAKFDYKITVDGAGGPGGNG